MKKTADAVIIGGGVVGCAIAAELAKSLSDVVLIERNNIETFASSANFGMVWLQTRFPGYDTKMSRKSQEIYEQYIADGVFDLDIEYEKTGGLTIAFDDIQVEVMKKQCAQKQIEGTNMFVISKQETLELEPLLNKELVGSIFCPDDARLNPMLTTMAFANLARRRGVKIYENTEVLSIDLENGKVKTINTTKGSILTQCAVNCAGTWARNIAAMAGVDLPVFPQRLQALVTEPLPHILNNRVIQVARDIEEGMDPEKATGFMFEFSGQPTEDNLPKLPVEDTIFTYIQQTLSDTVAIGTTSEFVGHDVRTTPDGLTAMLKGAVRVCPSLANANIIRTWASVVPFTFDGMPFVGKVENVEGFFLATGHGHAMCHAPALAPQLARLILTGEEDRMLKEKSLMRIGKQ